jgi:hypothetical protein
LCRKCCDDRTLSWLSSSVLWSQVSHQYMLNNGMIPWSYYSTNVPRKQVLFHHTIYILPLQELIDHLAVKCRYDHVLNTCAVFKTSQFIKETVIHNWKPNVHVKIIDKDKICNQILWKTHYEQTDANKLIYLRWIRGQHRD